MNGLHSVLLVWITLVSLVFQNCFLFVNSFVVKAEDTEQEETSNVQNESKDNLLQFTSNGSILGFKNDGVIVASKDKMVSFSFVDGNNVTPQSENTSKTEENKVQELNKVTYNNVWDGVSVEYVKNESSVYKSNYYLDNPEKLNQIQLKYNRPISLDNEGNLLIKFADNTLKETKPTAFQETPQGIHNVPVSFVILPNNSLSFSISDYLPDIPLIIDPALVWNTFLGSTGTDLAYDITVDSNQFIYVAGLSQSTWGTPVRALIAYDAFVAKLDSNGNLLLNTFLGGNGIDYGWGITTDTSGNIYVTGTSTATWGTPKRAYTSGSDAYVAKLDSNFNLVWNTFLGASGNENSGPALFSDSSIYVIGSSYATWGTPIRAFTPGASKSDGFIAKLDTDGNITWNTFLGGNNMDVTLEIVSDDLDNLFVSGQSDATWGTPVRAYTSSTDGFIAKLNSSGSLQWNTFLGGSGGDFARGIDIDSSYNVYIGGDSTATWGSPINPFSSGSSDAYMAKFDLNGNLLWNTFFGGSGSETCYSVLVYNQTGIYCAANSGATWGSPINPFSSSNDIYITKVDNNGTLLWNTFLGGTSSETSIHFALHDNYIYGMGYGSGTWGTPIREYTTSNEAFAFKLEASPSVTRIEIVPTTGGADISWNTDIDSVTQLEYGRTTGYGTIVSGNSGNYSSSHSLSLSGLTGCTNYHVRIKTEDSTGTNGTSGDYDFTTKGCESVTNDTTIQVPQSFIDTTTVSTVLTPSVDSNTGETTQKVVVIAPPQVFSFNAYLSSSVNNTLFPKVTTNTSGNVVNPTVVSTNLGILERVSDVSEVYYKTYAPAGYSPVNITQSLQNKPSILSLSFTGTYKNLKIAHSLDGKTWKILPNSVIDTKNKTVAVITKIGGYYTLVSPSQAKTTVLGTTTQLKSPSPVATIKATTTPKETVKTETQEKQTIIEWVITNIKNIFRK